VLHPHAKGAWSHSSCHRLTPTAIDSHTYGAHSITLAAH